MIGNSLTYHTGNGQLGINATTQGFDYPNPFGFPAFFVLQFGLDIRYSEMV